VTGRHGDALAADPVIAGDIARARAEAEALIAAHGHARTPASRFARWLRPARKAAPVPVSQLLEAPLTASRLLDLADISDTGTFTGIVRQHESEAEPLSEEAFARPATGATREVDAAERVVAERADMARIYVSPAGTDPWGPWDNGQPYPPSPGIAADLTDLPVFREAISRRTRCRAGECLCGTETAGQTWGEGMVAEGIHLLAPAEIAAFTFGAPQDDGAETACVTWTGPDGTPEPPEIATAMEACDAPNPVPVPAPQAYPHGHFTGIGAETTWHPADTPEPPGDGIEAYDARHPVPAAPEQAGTEDVTA